MTNDQVAGPGRRTSGIRSGPEHGVLRLLILPTQYGAREGERGERVSERQAKQAKRAQLSTRTAQAQQAPTDIRAPARCGRSTHSHRLPQPHACGEPARAGKAGSPARGAASPPSPFELGPFLAAGLVWSASPPRRGRKGRRRLLGASNSPSRRRRKGDFTPPTSRRPQHARDVSRSSSTETVAPGPRRPLACGEKTNSSGAHDDTVSSSAPVRCPPPCPRAPPPPPQPPPQPPPYPP